jgi:predicted nucleic acid-binding protein
VSGFLLDTNVPSELIRTRPEPMVVAWVYGQDESALYLSAVTIGELRRGFELLQQGRRRTALEVWLEMELLPRFRGRILPLDQVVAERWGVLDAKCSLRGTPLNTADGMIAATALEHGLTLATRNMRHFEGLGIALFDPWAEQPTRA